MAGPLVTGWAKIHAGRELLKQGYSWKQVRNALPIVDGDMVDAAASQADATAAGTSQEVGKLGDGTILAAIIAFLQSPQGQALIAALVQMLIHLIGG